MKFFSSLRNLFNKQIAILPTQRNDLVSFVRLKNGMVKLGSDVIVEEDYNLIFVHYNRVCDVLRPGTHKLKDVTIPKLFKYAKVYKTRRGIFEARSVLTDAYFVCLKEFSNNPFKTMSRIVSYKDDEKVKIKLEGTFSLKVIDSELFMKTLCNDYAIIRNKKTIKEVCSTVGFEVSNVLNRKNFKFDDYLFNKEKITQELQEKLNKITKTFGVETFNFLITNTIVPKKFVNNIQLGKTYSEEYKPSSQNEEIVKLVEDRLNGLKKDLDVVYVNQKGENSLSNDVLQQEDVLQSSKKLQEEYQTNFQNQVDKSLNLKENVENKKIEVSIETEQKEPSILGESKKEDDIVVDDELIDELIDKIDKRKKQKRNNRIIEIFKTAGIVEKADEKKNVFNKKCNYCGEELEKDSKFCNKCGKSTEELRICPCCGAKNFPNSTTCCVCKSKF